MLGGNVSGVPTLGGGPNGYGGNASISGRRKEMSQGTMHTQLNYGQRGMYTMFYVFSKYRVCFLLNKNKRFGY